MSPSESSPIVTLTTDFGSDDSYVGQLKGALLSTCPKLNLIDITHTIPRHDVATAARVLAESLPCFPAHSIHLAIVDPGVGTARRRLVLEAEISGKPSFLVGPDNGIFSFVPKRITAIWEIPGDTSSATFEGRDLFAPAVGRLARGESLQSFTRRSEAEPILLKSIAPAQLPEGLQGVVTHCDIYGNAITNLPVGEFENGLQLNIPTPLAFVRTYAEIPQNELRAVINSQGKVEIAARERPSGISPGLAVLLCRPAAK